MTGNNIPAQEHYQAVDAVLSLGAQLYRWPTSPAQVNAIILHESVASAGFEVRFPMPRV